jgi:hypothetical protein
MTWRTMITVRSSCLTAALAVSSGVSDVASIVARASFRAWSTVPGHCRSTTLRTSLSQVTGVIQAQHFRMKNFTPRSRLHSLMHCRKGLSVGVSWLVADAPPLADRDDADGIARG